MIISVLFVLQGDIPRCFTASMEFECWTVASSSPVKAAALTGDLMCRAMLRISKSSCDVDAVVNS